MGHGELIAVIAVMAVATFATRALPFVALRRAVDHPLVIHLGRRLPPAVMLLLVAYCLREVDFATAPHGAPQLIAVAVTAGLHLLFRQPLISIGAGTAAFMLMLRVGPFA
jgi:branched-subunit amino acid transport protein AzlD